MLTKTKIDKFQGITFSQVGLGCASAWGQKWFDEKAAIELVARGLDLGVTVFDTGASYSAGHAEPRLGRALKGRSLDNLLISTKVGTHVATNGKLYKDWSRTAILASIEKSRSRLGVDTIPLIYLHGPKIPHLNNELFDALNDAHSKNWVKWFGVNSFDDDVLDELSNIDIFDFIMLDYNILRIDREPIIEKLVNSGKVVVAGAALANQMHAPKFMFPKNIVDIWYLLRAFKNHRQSYLSARKFQFLKEVQDWTPSEIALAFVLRNPSITVSMFGTTRLAHLEENIQCCGKALPPDLERKIRNAFSVT